MFKEETLFILGAGASYPYGYPLGRDLIHQIVEYIEKDEIFLPLKNVPSTTTLVNLKSKGWTSFDAGDYETLDFNDLLIFNIPSTQNNIDSFRDNKGNQYLRIKIEKLDQFLKLKRALIEFDPVSIDAFLRDNPSHADAGKIMIIYSLLKCENKEKFIITNENTNDLPDESKNEKHKPDNWYSYLINDLLSGIKCASQFEENKVNFITFNYSVDLDYCLENKLSNIEILKNKSNSEWVQNFLNDKIHHVYGQLYKNKIVNTYGIFKDQKTDANLNMKRFIKSVQSKDEIKLIRTDNTDNQTKYKELISKAREIIIIGFGFDRDNLNLLGFPEIGMRSYRSFLKGKIFKYMDYQGRMNSLNQQFERIAGDNPNIPITRSTGQSIIDAYQNDFKIYLFQ